LSGITRVTDGQTDGQTDRRTDRILIARPRLHFMQRGENRVCVWCACSVVEDLYPVWC